MDLVTGDIRQLYGKYLVASLGSALAVSIYSFVDTIAVGQSEGPLGAAAMAVITPLYAVLVFLGILCGVGGAVLLGNSWGREDIQEGNLYFTVSLSLMVMLTLAAWISFGLYHEGIFRFFGADAAMMPKVMEYAKWIIWTFPVFVAPMFISAFIRNDGAPGLVMKAILVGGVVNMFGDWLLVFPLGLGMEGAAIATVVGTTVQVVLMCFYFLRSSCRLRLVRPRRFFLTSLEVLSVGLSSGVLDFGTLVLVIIMNNQIMRYGGATALSIYGVIAAVTSLFQALYCGVGQAVQPLASTNFGAMREDRARQVFRMALWTVFVMGLIFTGLGELFPIAIIKLLMAVNEEVVRETPGIVRTYFLVFPFMGVTVLSTYYLQAILRKGMSAFVAVMRSMVLSGILLFVLPPFLGLAGVLVAVPLADFIMAAVALGYIKRTH